MYFVISYKRLEPAIRPNEAISDVTIVPVVHVDDGQNVIGQKKASRIAADAKRIDELMEHSIGYVACYLRSD